MTGEINHDGLMASSTNAGNTTGINATPSAADLINAYGTDEKQNQIKGSATVQRERAQTAAGHKPGKPPLASHVQTNIGSARDTQMHNNSLKISDGGSLQEQPFMDAEALKV